MENFFGYTRQLLEQGFAHVETAYQDVELYDLVNQFSYDNKFYLDLAAKAERVLDIGCGTGRLLLPLLEQGCDVVGLDNSAEMLQIAADKCQAYGYQPRLILGDMRDFSLKLQFDLIIIPYHSMIYMLSDADRKAVLCSVHRHLVPGGRLAFDFDCQPNEIGDSLPWLALQGIHPLNNEPLVQVVQMRGINQEVRLLNQINYYFGSETRITVKYSYESSIAVAKMRTLLESENFELSGVYQDYARTPYTDGSECIMIAQRKEA